MIHAALIVLGEESAGRVLGLRVAEYRVRCAMRIGARHIVIDDTRGSATVAGTLAHIRPRGVTVSRLRSPDDIGTLFHPDETVLLMSGSAAIADAQLLRLIALDAPALLCIEGHDARFELMDARNCWLGFARLKGTDFRALAAGEPDWDIASVVMRQAVRDGAERAIVPSQTTIVDISDRGSSRAVAEMALISANTRQGWAIGWLVDPLARQVALMLHRYLSLVAAIGVPVAVLLTVVAALILTTGYLTPGFLAAMLAIVIARTGEIALRATSGRVLALADSWAGSTPIGDLLVAAPVLVASAQLLPDRAPLVLAVVLGGLLTLIARLQRQARPASWQADAPGVLAILSFACLAGPSGMFPGLAMCALHAFSSLFAVQNTLSRNLTSPH